VERPPGSPAAALQQDGEVPGARRASVLEVDVVIAATGYGRTVWSPRCAFCGGAAEPADGLCSCGAEYLGNGWWWIPDGEEMA
jgi:hypothetical protein